MIRRLWQRMCPHCIHDETPVTEHPAIQALDRNASALDRMLKLVGEPSYRDRGESGHAARDMLTGDYGQGEERR